MMTGNGQINQKNKNEKGKQIMTIIATCYFVNPIYNLEMLVKISARINKYLCVEVHYNYMHDIGL